MTQILNSKQIQIPQIQNPKQYDLEERTLRFSSQTRVYIKKLPRTVANVEDIKQLARSSGSMGANYIEANEALSRKDFVHRVKICRKETKESIYWLRLVDIGGSRDLESERQGLVQEATELMKIFGAIIEKSK